MALETRPLTQFVDDLFAAWNSRDGDQCARFYRDEYVGDDVGSSSQQRSPQEVREWLAGYWAAFPDLHFSRTGPVTEQPGGAGDVDRVAFQYLARGTHDGPLMGVPATHRQVTFRGMSMLTLQGGQVVQGTYFWDGLALLRQLGML